MAIMKNIPMAEVVKLKEQVAYQEGQVVSKTLVQNSAVSVTLFSFAKETKASTSVTPMLTFLILSSLAVPGLPGATKTSLTN